MLPLRSKHMERKTKVHMAYSRAHTWSQVITCLSYGTSLLAVTIVNNYAVTCPCKKLAGWPFLRPYRNVAVFQNITLHRATKIRLAFHFIERKYALCMPMDCVPVNAKLIPVATKKYFGNGRMIQLSL